MDSLSTVGTWIGAALASSTQLKPDAAAPARAAEVLRNLRRSNKVFMGTLRHGETPSAHFQRTPDRT
jgi:hypothetical protein